ncbi:MAG: DUF1800 family protein [Hyphomicrobiales bacterium]|nr:DUF1800 family protein [Hyphomicrobiales bacterium]MBV8441182.1 DUF1800 family protein [Hyphomicrobiales bacterium]
MTIGPDYAQAVTAFNRFGLGARPGDLNAAAGDPQGFLLEELWTANIALIRDRAPASGQSALQAYYLEQQQLRAERVRIAARPSAAQSAERAPAMLAGRPGGPIATIPPTALSMATMGPVPPAGPSTAQTPSALAAAPLEAAPPQGSSLASTSAISTGAAPPEGVTMAAPHEAKPAAAKPQPPVVQAQFSAEASARLQKQLQARAGFVERLVAFWSNHFAVSAAKSAELRIAAGPFEREAIRPNALGKFSALLRAAETHPAMILFLDNQNSIGPNAGPGKFAGRGLNENLAREILELHTLGVGSGYTQADVTELARIITGWSVAGPESEAGQPGAFLFKPNWHEPGQRTLLGKTYAEAGVEQGRAALDDLARHPATARHIATKLVRHFVADDPPVDLVNALQRKFLDSGGDLAVVASALVSDDRAWSARPTKIRTPLEFVVGAARATGFSPSDPGLYLQSLNLLGMPLWQPGGPNGFSDMSDAWASPEGMKARLDLAWSMGQRMRGAAEPMAALKTALGETASPETRQAVERAESREQALALLFMAPEFQRR